MSRKAGLRAVALVAALAMLLGVAGVATAAGGAAPRLLTPNHRHVATGRIRLVVDIPLRAHGVFITIAPNRKLDRYGYLKDCAAIRCDFVAAKHWKGDKYSYVAQFNFPGYWSVTPGKYYWQAHYYLANFSADYYSTIGWFVVK